ncbi:MAG: hypothetical protein PHG21_02895 [Azoarcus sp.]|nr:hypothetical protein [Azoarcus sp.]
MMGMRIPSPLLRPLAIAALLLTMSGSVLGLSVYARYERTRALALAHQTLAQTRLQLQRTREETADSRRARSRLDALEVTDIDRVQALLRDALRRLQSDPLLSSVELKPMPRAPARPDAPGLPKRAILRLSLRAGVLHEEALSAALQTLTATSGVIVIPRGCQVARVHPINDGAPVVSPLQARCELDWLTLHPVAGISS